MYAPRDKKIPLNAAEKDGIILLLVVVILTAIFSISIGVFSVILGQVNTSQIFESSDIALNAADQSVERTLYRDRQKDEFPCAPISSPCTTTIPAAPIASSGGCMSAVTLIKTATTPATAQITAKGLSTLCGIVSERTAARAFLIAY